MTIITEPENSRMEYKRELTDGLEKEVVAFLNAREWISSGAVLSLAIRRSCAFSATWKLLSTSAPAYRVFSMHTGKKLLKSATAMFASFFDMQRGQIFLEQQTGAYAFCGFIKLTNLVKMDII